MRFLIAFASSLLFLTVYASSSQQRLVNLLTNGGYILNSDDKGIETVERELEYLKPAIEEAVQQINNGTKEESGNENGVKMNKEPTVFQVGIVIKEKKLMRRLDFIGWARTIGMKALALGKRYIGVSFVVDNSRHRLYVFFVEEKEIETLNLEIGRNELSTNVRKLFDKLKEITKDD